MFINVDLPQPLGPKIDTILPRGRSRLKLVYSGLPAKRLLRPRTVTCVLGAGRSVRTESVSVGSACGCTAVMGSAPLMVVDLSWRMLSEQSRGRVCAGARVRRSALRADSLPLLDRMARVETRSAHCVRCARTVDASQILKRALRARGHALC